MRMTPSLGFVEAAQQVDDGGLAAAGRADQGDGLARLHPEGEVGQDRFAVLVVEVDMVEFDLALQRLGWDGFRSVVRPPARCRSA